MGGYLAYTKYKDSGVEWLGKIPSHWIMSKAKFVSKVFIPQRNKPELNTDGEGLPWLTMDDMSGDRVSSTSFRVSEESAAQAGSRVLKKGSVVASCVGNFGVVAINELDVIINQQLQAFIPTDIDSDYLRLTVSISSDYFKMRATAATIEYVNQAGFANMPLALPLIEEQRSIARFLDYKTAQIYALIAKKETLLKKLAEKRTALISQAVTKGCDRAIPIKDSGIEWLGEIPPHWKVMHLKRALDSSDYGISDNLSASSTHPVLRMGNLQNEETTMDDVKYIDKVDPLLILKPNDILFNRTNSLDLVGKVALFRGSDKFEVTFASYLVRFRTNELADPEYLVFFLGREEVQKKASSMAWRAIGQANLNPNRYGYLEICLPPMKEQKEILSYLKEKLSDLQQPIHKVKIAIAKLKEYRTALITNAVTGKIDVRDVMLEPEPVEAA